MTRRAVGAALLTAVLVTAVGYGGDTAFADNESSDRLIGPGIVTVNVDIHHSRFSIAELDVAAGSLVRFVVRNDDPIHHELIIGSDAVHAAHTKGTERQHPPVPGEVSVGPGETGLTMFQFDEPATILFACHLPRHFEYGMHGEINVR